MITVHAARESRSVPNALASNTGDYDNVMNFQIFKN
jgi:hypothetical protein